MARDTTNLVLRVWNLLTDNFNHAELEDNWRKIDFHDHKPFVSGGNGGVTIPTGGITPLAVNNSLLATDSVDARVIASAAITSAEIATGAVATVNIANAAVVIPKLVATPAALIVNDSSQAVGTNAVALTFDPAAAYVTDAMSIPASRLTVNTPGVYSFVGNFTYEEATAATGYRKLQLRMNAVSILSESAAGIINDTAQGMSVAFTGLFSVGDYIELVAVTNSDAYGSLASLSGSWLAHT